MSNLARPRRRAIRRKIFWLPLLRSTLEFSLGLGLSIWLGGLLLGLWGERLIVPLNVLAFFAIALLMMWAGRACYYLIAELADLLEGGRTLDGYVTLHYVEPIWKRASTVSRSHVNRVQVGERYRLNIVPANAFNRWLGAPESARPSNFVHPVSEAEYRFEPDTMALARPIPPAFAGSGVWQEGGSTVAPISINNTPAWAFEIVRLGDLVRLTYTRRSRRILAVEVLISVMN